MVPAPAGFVFPELVSGRAPSMIPAGMLDHRATLGPVAWPLACNTDPIIELFLLSGINPRLATFLGCGCGTPVSI